MEDFNVFLQTADRRGEFWLVMILYFPQGGTEFFFLLKLASPRSDFNLKLF